MNNIQKKILKNIENGVKNIEKFVQLIIQEVLKNGGIVEKMDGIVDIFKRSEEMYGIKYDYYIEDGDLKV